MALNYTSIGFILVYHIIALYGLWNVQMNWIDIQSTLLMYFFTGFGILGLAHFLILYFCKIVKIILLPRIVTKYQSVK